MNKQPVIEALTQLLAETYALYLKTQNYHWNVTGPNFKSLHELFEMQYTDLAAAADEIAERIRALGAKAPGSFKIYDKLKTIKDADDNANAGQMVKALYEDHLTMVNTLKQVLKQAQAADDEVTISLVDERLSVHEKTAWMLKSSI